MSALAHEVTPDGTSDGSLPPSGRRVRGLLMRPILPDDLRFLYGLATNESDFRWRYRNGPPTVDQFAHDLQTGVLAQFVIVTRDQQLPIGLVAAYWPDLMIGLTHVGVVMEPRYHMTGAGIEAAGLFIDYLFQTWPLRKLYFETPEWNLPQFASGRNRLYVEEGRLSKHEYFRDKYWDLFIFALYREDWHKRETRHHRSSQSRKAAKANAI